MRKQLLVPALTALFVLPAAYLQAQTADEIVERSLTAQGGRAALSKLTSRVDGNYYGLDSRRRCHGNRGAL